MSKGSAIHRLAMTMVARASQTSANQSGPAAPNWPASESIIP